MADGSSTEVDQPERQQLVFRRRQLLRFSGLAPGARYSLPFFLHNEDGVPVFTRPDGSHVMFCVDSEYQALDHCLLWLDFPVCVDETTPSREGEDQVSATMYGYFGGGQPALELWAGCKPSAFKATPGMPQPFEDILLTADYFDGGKDIQFGALAGWELRAGAEKAVRFIPVDAMQPGQRFLKPLGLAVQLSAPLARPLPLTGAAALLPVEAEAAGMMLRRSVHGLQAKPCSRLHLRVRFQDNMAKGVPQSHWVGLTSQLGTGAVGLSPHFPDHYSFVNGFWHHGKMPKLMHEKWERFGLKRSKGWHLFEITFESGLLSIAIDGEPLYSHAACDASQDDAIWLASECGACGNWLALELLHTPLGRGSWEAGLQQVDPLSAVPWEIVSREEGHWIVSEAGALEQMPLQEVVEHEAEAEHQEDKPAEEEEPQEDEPAEEEEPQEGEPAEEEAPQAKEEESECQVACQEAEVGPPAAVVPSPPQRPRSKKSQRPKQLGGLSIECWSLPNESDLARLDRVIDVIVDRLREANFVVPANFQRVGECEEPQHEKCHVFSFGTRRLHISMREGVGGKVTLAVRVGGGYMDLVEFIRKNGALEQLRLQQAQGSGSESHHARFCSVLSKGRRQLKEMN